MFCVSVSRMITLKVLNSIVLLGTSCVFVKEANMEEKLFDPPPSAVSSRVNSRAHRTKHVNTSPQQGSNQFVSLSIPEMLNRVFCKLHRPLLLLQLSNFQAAMTTVTDFIRCSRLDN